MKKLFKNLFMVTLILVISLILSTNVRAAQEDSYGYEDFDNDTSSSTTTDDNKTTETEKKEETKTEETKKEETTDPVKEITPNTATTTHAQAGGFEYTLFAVATAVTTLLIGFGYKKLKKYNF